MRSGRRSSQAGICFMLHAPSFPKRVNSKPRNSPHVILMRSALRRRGNCCPWQTIRRYRMMVSFTPCLPRRRESSKIRDTSGFMYVYGYASILRFLLALVLCLVLPVQADVSLPQEGESVFRLEPIVRAGTLYIMSDVDFQEK